MGNKFRDKVVEEDLEAPRPESEPEVEVEETQRGGREGVERGQRGGREDLRRIVIFFLQVIFFCYICRVEEKSNPKA